MAFRICTRTLSARAVTRVASARPAARFASPFSTISTPSPVLVPSLSRFVSTSLRLNEEEKKSEHEAIGAEPTHAQESVRADKGLEDPIASTTSPLNASESTSSSGENVAAGAPTTSVGEAANPVSSAASESFHLFVGGLSWNVDAPWLRLAIGPLVPEEEAIASVRVARTHLGKSRGFGFIEVKTKEAYDALCGHQSELDGRMIEIKPGEAPKDARPRERRPATDSGLESRNPPGSTIWLGNLAWEVESSDLESAFAEFGTVERVALPRDQETGRPRGIGYLQFSTQEEAEKAFKVGREEGLVLGGRNLRIDYAPAQRSDRPGGSRRPEGGERRSYGSRQDGGERRSYGDRQDGGERRSQGGRQEGGERRSYGDRQEGGGERRSYGGRDNYQRR